MDEANPFEYIEPLFKFMETNPNIDYGMPAEQAYTATQKHYNKVIYGGKNK